MEPLARTGSGRVGLRVEGVAKRYGSVAALNDFSLSMAEGETVVLLGPSGSGKTTLLRTIAGLEKPDTGRIFFGDQDVTSVPMRKRGIGIVFQSYALFPHMTVRDNIAYGLRVRRWPAAKIREVVDDVLRLVDLEQKAESWPLHLSGGQQQRVALARALVINPSVLLLDEPFGALDLKLRRRMQFEMRQLFTRIRPNAIHVTHDQEEAMVIGDRIAVMHLGTVEQIGSATELYDSPATEFVAAFLGEANLLRAVPNSRGTPDALVIGGTPFPVAEPAGEGQTFCIRPERIALHPLVGGASDGSESQPTGQVDSVMFLGDVIEYEVSCGDDVLRVRMPSPARRFREGDAVVVELPSSIPLVR